MPAILWSAQNEFLSVALHADASAVIRDLRNGASWRMGPVALQEEGPLDVGHVWLRNERSICEQFAGRFRGVPDGDACRFTLLGREGQPLGTFRVRLRLDGPWFECRITDVDECLPSLIFPTPIESASLVLPQGAGRWIRKPLPSRYFWTFPAHLNMRWFGGLRGRHGWLAVIDEGYQNAGVLAANLSATTGWLKSLGAWNGPRTIRYQFVRGNYVELAKAYRAYAVEKKLFRPLTEKIQSTPAVGDLMGGRAVFFWQAKPQHPERLEELLQPASAAAAPSGLKVNLTHADVLRLTGEIRQAADFRGLVALCGWIRGGFDESHPDIWPPEPALGPVDDLRKILALPSPLIGTLHDNYQDIYRQCPSWPKGVIRLPSGGLMPGGYWSGGQAYILNPRNGVEYARRNWEKVKTLGLRALYCDTATGVQFYESYEPGNTLTRAQDEACKKELLGFFKEQGLVLGSEYGADFGVPYTDFFLVQHAHVPGETIPLWALVFHDAVISYTGTGGAGVTLEQLRRQWLVQMLWGYQVRWYFSSADEWNRSRDAFRESFMVDHWHARTGAAEMLSHRFLAADVEETVFANGLAIRVNLAVEERLVEGERLPALSYTIREQE